MTKPKTKIFKKEYLLFIGTTVLTVALFFIFNVTLFNEEFNLDNQSLQTSSSPTNNQKLDLFSWLKNGDFPVFEITVEPEFIDALNSAVPKNMDCQKVRYKSVPVKSVVINGKALKGQFFMKYRGFCPSHWGFRQKSIKLQSKRGEKFGRYDTVNLTSMNTDPSLFEIWTNKTLVDLGGVASRVSLIKVYINGEYDGIREIVENLDEDLLNEQNLLAGPIYREREHATLGTNLYALQDIWEKNAYKNKPWDDWYDFNKSIKDSLDNRERDFERFTDVAQYLSYYAFVNVIGSTHVNNHNIPAYRPRNDVRFRPIGYDFYSTYAGKFSKIFPALQMSYVNMNGLSSLFWSYREYRYQLYSKIAELLKKSDELYESYEDILDRAKPDLVRDIADGLILGEMYHNQKKSIKDFNYDDYKMRKTDLAKVKGRLDLLSQAYWDPTLRLQSDWQSRDHFQLALEGLGAYEFALQLSPSICKSSDKIEALLPNGQKTVVAECKNANWNSNIIDVEVNEIESWIYGMDRNPVGATVLIDVLNPGKAKIDKVIFISKTTNKPVKNIKTWPFNIQNPDLNQIGINSKIHYVKPDELVSKEGYSVFNLDPKTLEFRYINNRIHLTPVFDQSEHFDIYMFGPILCWNYENTKNCMEFTKQFLVNRGWVNKDFFRNINSDSGTKLTQIKQQNIEGCSEYVFRKGAIQVVESLVFPKECHVRFESGADIRFAEQTYMVIKGEVTFPASQPEVTFSSIGQDWGGVVIEGMENVVVQNAKFMKANEFYASSKRYTGALNIMYPKTYVVEQCMFLENLGDDGLNVKGGKGEIRFNYFYANRDAIDVDLGQSDIHHNFIYKTNDDGVDSGTAELTIRENIIIGSGDKGASIGEKSRVNLNSNLIVDGNVGIAVKDGSHSSIQGNLISGNQIALSVYKKTDKSFSNKDTYIEGDSYFEKNGVDYKLNGQTSQNSFYKKINDKRAWRASVNSIHSTCAPCKERLDEISVKRVLDGAL